MEKYKKIFLSEAKKHIATGNKSLLDLEKDPYDVEVSRYPDKNPELKQELEILLNLKHNKTVIDYSLQIPNRSVINI